MKSLTPQAEKPAPEGRRNRLKPLIVVLAALLVLSGGGLAARWIYLTQFTTASGTATVPDNLISETEGIPETPSEPEPIQPGAQEQTDSTPAPEETSPQTTAGQAGGSGQAAAQSGSQEAAELELYQGRPEANVPFAVENMLPGDRVTRYFCLRVSHDGELSLFFEPEVTAQTQNLAGALQLKVTRLDTGAVLWDRPFAQADGQAFATGLPGNDQEETIVYYRIDVSADTSMGNEYQLASLTADFHWYVDGEGQGTLTPPKTGDTAMPAVLWTVLCLSAAALAVLLVIQRKGAKSRDRT